jgi:Raf kinase inhibitor-like YbhB/YbcL family protein
MYLKPDLKEIKEGKEPEGVQGKNTSGRLGYQGPCPPDREHRYFFKLYALDIKLNLPEGSSKKEVEQAMEGHIIEKTKLTGLYERE